MRQILLIAVLASASCGAQAPPQAETNAAIPMPPETVTVPPMSTPSNATPQTATANGCAPAPASIASARLSPCQGLRTLLQLIRDADSLGYFSPERLQKAFGVPVQPYPDEPNEYGYWEEDHPQWTWGFEFSTSATGPSFEYGYFEKSSASNAELTDFCDPDFDAFVKELDRFGLSGGITRGEFGQVDYADYEKPGLRVQVLPQGRSEADAGHLCVLKVIVR